MSFDEGDISKKSSLIALVLCLTLGQFGVHRLYVGKFITAILYFVVGGTSIVMEVMGFNYAFISRIIYFIFLVFDVYALYSNSFTDSKGKLLTDEKTLVYDTYADREQILFVSKLNKILVLILGIAVYITYYLLSTFLF